MDRGVVSRRRLRFDLETAFRRAERARYLGGVGLMGFIQSSTIILINGIIAIIINKKLF